MRVVGSICVTLGVFLAGFVISEPAPYELFMAGLVGVWFILGLKLTRQTAPLLALLLIFNVGGMMSVTQMNDLDTAPMYLAVSIFLALTAVFYAAIIEEAYERLDLIFRAWVAGAIITSILGILGYFHAFPGSEVFTLYDRAKGAFQDPNVFGPFIIPPALYLVHGMLTQSILKLPLKAVGVMILAFGVLLSFSRAAKKTLKRKKSNHHHLKKNFLHAFAGAGTVRYSVLAPPAPTPSSLPSASPPTEMSTGGRSAEHAAKAACTGSLRNLEKAPESTGALSSTAT